jgi:hypothetical protein
MTPFSNRPPQEPAFQQFGVEPVGFRSAVFPKYRDTRGMDHVRLDATGLEPTRQPEAVAAGFEGKRNPRANRYYITPVRVWPAIVAARLEAGRCRLGE